MLQRLHRAWLQIELCALDSLLECTDRTIVLPSSGHKHLSVCKAAHFNEGLLFFMLPPERCCKLLDPCVCVCMPSSATISTVRRPPLHAHMPALCSLPRWSHVQGPGLTWLTHTLLTWARQKATPRHSPSPSTVITQVRMVPAGNDEVKFPHSEVCVNIKINSWRSLLQNQSFNSEGENFSELKLQRKVTFQNKSLRWKPSAESDLQKCDSKSMIHRFYDIKTSLNLLNIIFHAEAFLAPPSGNKVQCR